MTASSGWVGIGLERIGDQQEVIAVSTQEMMMAWVKMIEIRLHHDLVL